MDNKLYHLSILPRIFQFCTTVLFHLFQFIRSELKKYKCPIIWYTCNSVSIKQILGRSHTSSDSFYITFADELRGLHWDTRFQIIKGICQGLCYLHKEKHIIHMDLKPSNILLDDRMVSKITGFGISELITVSDRSLQWV